MRIKECKNCRHETVEGKTSFSATSPNGKSLSLNNLPCFICPACGVKCVEQDIADYITQQVAQLAR